MITYREKSQAANIEQLQAQVIKNSVPLYLNPEKKLSTQVCLPDGTLLSSADMSLTLSKKSYDHTILNINKSDGSTPRDNSLLGNDSILK